MRSNSSELRTETDAKAAKRLMCAVLYSQVKSPAKTEQLLGFPEQTIYDWLDVVAERDLPRPEQSTRLTDEQWTELTATRPASPSEAGYDDSTWTPALVREHTSYSYSRIWKSL